MALGINGFLDFVHRSVLYETCIYKTLSNTAFRKTDLYTFSGEGVGDNLL
jgi:hypothetical protein